MRRPQCFTSNILDKVHSSVLADITLSAAFKDPPQGYGARRLFTARAKCRQIRTAGSGDVRLCASLAPGGTCLLNVPTLRGSGFWSFRPSS
jgi:hypothetical protein